MDLHVVSFNVPWPADYGGVIDVYYRIKALAQNGIQVHLHCYTYGRQPQPQLESLCADVHYYRRITRPRKLLTVDPYIVSSRMSHELLQNLMADNHAVLFEGLHCCGLLPKLRKASPTRCLLVRTHNIEHQYYKGLCQCERNPLKKVYFRMESCKLQRFEPVLSQATAILSISAADADYFQSQHYAPVHLMPPSYDEPEETNLTDMGSYILYHGDLSVPDNVSVVQRILSELAPHCKYPLWVAGRNPTQAVLKTLKAYNRRAQAQETPQAQLIANPNDVEMKHLIENAQVCLLLTNQAAGAKLKLLGALNSGRHCVVNTAMVQGVDLAPLCHVADDNQAILQAIHHCFETPFTAEMRAERRNYLQQHHYGSNEATVLLLQNLIHPRASS